MGSHHYFLLNLNPWPLISSTSAFNLMTSLLLFFKYGFLLPVFSSLTLISISSFSWWLNYSSESSLGGMSSMNLDLGLKYGMILFISSEVFLFFSFFWGYFHFSLSPSLEIGLIWPPVNYLFFDFSSVPLINTFILLSSGLTVTISHFFLYSGKEMMMSFWLFLTVVLGCIFTILQGIEYSNSFFGISDGNFGTAFFTLTGFHGIHVMVGTIYLTVSLFRCLSVGSSEKNFLMFELSSWYWHFVDVVWIFLYFFLYYLN